VFVFVQKTGFCPRSGDTVLHLMTGFSEKYDVNLLVWLEIWNYL